MDSGLQIIVNVLPGMLQYVPMTLVYTLAPSIIAATGSVHLPSTAAWHWRRVLAGIAVRVLFPRHSPAGTDVS